MDVPVCVRLAWSLGWTCASAAATLASHGSYLVDCDAHRLVVRQVARGCGAVEDRADVRVVELPSPLLGRVERLGDGRPGGAALAGGGDALPEPQIELLVGKAQRAERI